MLLNQIDNDLPKACIHNLFETQVEKTPNAIAVCFKDRQLTYQELDDHANQVAKYLQTLGVKPEVLVGICLERSLEVIIAILAILKSGGAYLPLDPAYPQERLDYIIQDAKISIILTQQHLKKQLPQESIKVIAIDTEWQTIICSQQENLVRHDNPDNLAYVIYTSGSTGKPKGVAIAHHALVNFCQAAVQEYEINDRDRILQFASLSFDASVEEIYPCLIAGGTLVLRTQEMGYSSSLLLQKCHDYGITILDLPTAFWHLLTSELEQNSQLQLPESIRLVIIGGEAVNAKKVASWNRLVGTSCQLINTYGPTEATVVATIYKIPSQIHNLATIPIGKPLPNVQTYILDDNLQPVVIGIPGELYIGGMSLARGYLNNPELTAQKFISNPFLNGEAQKRKSEGEISNDLPPPPLLYKTGDQTRYLSDGNIEFLGRIDNQVKIRGFRIELGEIEAVLEQHPLVSQTVVVAQEDRSNNKRIVAYIVPQSNSVPTATILRQFVQTKLPEYMVPSAFVILASFPLTPNGKIDRKALPIPDRVSQPLETTCVNPRNNVEVKLVGIWEKVLGIKPIGVKDNFFELGGDSLQAVRLFTEIERAFKQKLPIVSLLETPTIEELAKQMFSDQKSCLWRSLVPIQTNGSKPPLFLVHARGTSVMLYRELARYLGSEQPVYALQPRGLNGEEKPLQQVEDMAKYYIQEIKTIQPEGPYLLGGYSLGGTIAFEMAQQLTQQGEKISLLALLDCQGPNFCTRLPFFNRILLHLQNIGQQKHHYVITKSISWIRWNLRELQYNLQRIAILSLQIAQLPLPFSLRNLLIEDLNSKAAEIYQPKSYQGKITLLRAVDWLGGIGYQVDKYLGWSSLAREGVEIYEVPGDHLSMFKATNLPILAEQLKICLDRISEVKESANC
ncbi:amino acid adenylation domain-containing protein [Stanieria sp. NIES-3757]|nr:amino acid adenylation domain-containing protein [Stanieria sp. NIES-3757]